MTASIDRTRFERVIAFINGKGGVGKTTCSANVAGLLATNGMRVLAIDLDPQGNLAEEFGYTGDDRDDEGKSLATALAFGSQAVVVRSVRENLDVLVGGPALETAHAGLAANAQKDPTKAKLALAHVLEPIIDEYDMVVIDCPPGHEMLQNAAIAAARWAVVPIQTDLSSRKGLGAVAKRLDAVLDVNPDLDLLGVVLFDVPASASAIDRDTREAVATMFGDGDVIFNSTIRTSKKTAKVARDLGLLVNEVELQSAKAPKWWELRQGVATTTAVSAPTATSVAEDLQSLTQEIIDRMTTALQKGAA